MFLCHDEIDFNDAQGTTWADPEGRGAIRSKEKGRGLRISDYIDTFALLSSNSRSQEENLSLFPGRHDICSNCSKMATGTMADT